MNNLEYNDNIITNLINEINDLKKSVIIGENNYKSCKKELRELKEELNKFKNNKIIF